MLKPTEFLEKYPLQFSLPLKESRALEKVLKKAFESYSIEYKKETGVKCGNLQYYDFYVTCLKTNFAQAFFHIGLLYSDHVLPIWNKRHNKKPNLKCKNK